MDLHLGIVGGTDGHDTQPGAVCRRETQLPQHPYGGGLTVAVLGQDERFDRAALFDAIAGRHTYATSGPALPVLVSYSSGGIGLGAMGEDLVVAADQPLEVVVKVPVEHQAVVANVFLMTSDGEQRMPSVGDGGFAVTIEPQHRPAWVYPRVELDGAAWYGQSGCDDGGVDQRERLWLSPSWLLLPGDDTGLPQDSDPSDSSSGDSSAGDTVLDACDPCECECTCTTEERGCGLLGASGLVALTFLGLPLVLGRRASTG